MDYLYWSAVHLGCWLLKKEQHLKMDNKDFLMLPVKFTCRLFLRISTAEQGRQTFHQIFKGITQWYHLWRSLVGGVFSWHDDSGSKKWTSTYMQLGCLVTRNAILHPPDVSKILFSLDIISEANYFIINQMGTNRKKYTWLFLPSIIISWKHKHKLNWE